MSESVRMRTVAVLSLVFTYVFFLDYLPPFRRVHLPYDLHGYHHPLLVYAFEALRAGRFPEWDATQYCGMTFAGNPQVALFYPLTWLLFAVNVGRQTISYQSLQDLVFVHVWLAFMLCYAWLRYRRIAALPAILGGAIFAFSGYLMTQLQHLGLVIGYAWMPLGFWGIDQAVEERNWRPLWKVAAASALCLLGGYIPTWTAFAVFMLAYAAWRWKALAGAAAALTASLALAAVQILPTLEALPLKAVEIKYGSGVKELSVWTSWLVPNYYDFSLHAGAASARTEYFYLGAPALFGLLCLIPRRRWRDILPLAGVLAVAVVLASNLFNLPWELVIRHSSLLSQVLRDYYVLAGVSLVAAPLAAVGLDHFLRQRRPEADRVLGWLAAALVAAFSARTLVSALTGGLHTGWKSVAEMAFSVAVFGLGICILRSQRRARAVMLTASLLAMVAVEYYAYGAARRFNAAEGVAAAAPVGKEYPAMDKQVYAELRAHRDYRIALDQAPFPFEVHLHGLHTPEGFDPLVTTQYRKLISRIGAFRTDRELDVDVANTEGLRIMGVRYFLSREGGPQYSRAARNPDLRLMQPSESFYKVFELANPRPPYGWASASPENAVRVITSTPETRAFEVNSLNGGPFTLSEQLFPGWQAAIDGKPAPIKPWNDAFQSIDVPPGAHRIEFKFRSSGLRMGALVSLAAVLALCFAVLRKRARDQRQSTAAQSPEPVMIGS